MQWTPLLKILHSFACGCTYKFFFLLSKIITIEFFFFATQFQQRKRSQNQSGLYILKWTLTKIQPFVGHVEIQFPSNTERLAWSDIRAWSMVCLNRNPALQYIFNNKSLNLTIEKKVRNLEVLSIFCPYRVADTIFNMCDFSTSLWNKSEIRFYYTNHLKFCLCINFFSFQTSNHLYLYAISAKKKRQSKWASLYDLDTLKESAICRQCGDLISMILLDFSLDTLTWNEK